MRISQKLQYKNNKKAYQRNIKMTSNNALKFSQFIIEILSF